MVEMMICSSFVCSDVPETVLVVRSPGWAFFAQQFCKLSHRLYTCHECFKCRGGVLLPYSLGGSVPLGSRKSYPLPDQILQIPD